jgi:acetylornithine deacetylase/succinyl-diaminopimelate desuccinylase-like protein
MAELRRVIADTGIAITTNANTERFGAAPSQIPAELLTATTDLTDNMFKGVPVIPTMSTGATDGRMLRQAGIPTYGVSGIFAVPGENNAHGQDEKLRVKSYYDGLAFLDRLVRRITTKTTM